ncbi:MAG: restriction endonuclease subunit S [Verrucomicrobia bacterium]|nr:restriction endonuclease subunit S [Verrucomicrobiota bacterium]
MATETKNTKAFYSTEIPEDWSISLLGELGTFSKGKGILKEQVISDGLPCIRYGEIYTTHDFIIKDFKSFIAQDVATESKEIKNGDILFAGSGETVEEIGKAVAYIGTNKAYAGGDVIILSTKQVVNPECLSYALETDFVKRQKRVLGQGNSVVHIYSSDLSKVKIPLPPLPEQKAIAQVLSTADAAIHTTEKLIAQKELRKKWLMQQLLTGKKRLKGFENTKWKIQPLENFIKPIVREVSKPSTPYLGIGLRSHGKGTFLKYDEQPEKNSMDKFYVVRPNDLIVNITFAWEQAIAIVRPEDDGALASHRFPTYTFIEEKGHPDFFRFFILQPRMKFMLEMISPGGAGRNRVMSKSDFIKLEFLLPDYKEQTAIAQVLQAADKEITLLKAKAEKLREQKKGLMQVLLTGKVRLKINNT